MSAPCPCQEILPDFYRLEVDLPGNPLKALNAYVVRSSDRCLLIDNGFNTLSSEKALRAALDSLGVKLDRTDFFLTHMHSDHSGLTMRLRSSQQSCVYCSAEDGQRLNLSITDPSFWQAHQDMMCYNGFPRPELESLYKAHPGKTLSCQEPLPITPVTEGDSLHCGQYHFSVVDVPGHTPGHTALLERHSGVLLAGDHILAHITPNINHWRGVKDSLGDYLHSLDKVRALPVQRTLPGHRALVENTPKRIDQLKAHHQTRLQELCGILEQQGPLTAYQAATRMRWTLRGQWADFPVQQRCFATIEALAHLDHLACTERATAKDEEAPQGLMQYFSLGSCQTV